MWKKIIALAACILFSITLCGCDFVTVDTAELLSPPELSGELKPIYEVIKKTASAGYIMKYPSRGDYRSAVIREDINSDGILEAFAFYSVADRDIITMHVNVIGQKDGEWSSLAVQQIVAAGVDKIEFSDLDGDGIKELLVGWQIYGTSEMQLAVYSVGENSLNQRMLEKYSHFAVCDLDEDDRNEILILKVGFADMNNRACLYAVDKEGSIEVSACELDRTVKTVNEPIIATLSTGKPAAYIDVIKGVGAVTEVVFIEKGKLLNPLFDSKSGETLSTLRSVSFGIKDINADGIIEIPVQNEVAAVADSDVNEKLYLTNWCSFNGEVLTNQLTAMMNVNDGYYLVLSPNWSENIAVLKDIDNRVREIYLYNQKDKTVGKSLVFIKAVNKSDWDIGKYNDLKATEIMNDGKTSYVCRVSEEGEKLGINLEYIKANFKLFE